MNRIIRVLIFFLCLHRTCYLNTYVYHYEKYISTKNILYTHARCTVKNVRKLLRRRTVYLHVFKTYGYTHELFLFPYVYRSLGWCVWCRAYQRNISPVLKKCRRICVWSILYRPHTIEYYFTSPSLGPGNTK